MDKYNSCHLLAISICTRVPHYILRLVAFLMHGCIPLSRNFFQDVHAFPCPQILLQHSLLPPCILPFVVCVYTMLVAFHPLFLNFFVQFYSPLYKLSSKVLASGHILKLGIGFIAHVHGICVPL